MEFKQEHEKYQKLVDQYVLKLKGVINEGSLAKEEALALCSAFVNVSAILISALVNSISYGTEANREEFIEEWKKHFSVNLDDKIKYIKTLKVKMSDLGTSPEQVMKEFEEHMKMKYGKKEEGV